MFNEIVEVMAMDGTRNVISSKSAWSELEVIAYAGLVWRYPVVIIKRYQIQKRG